MNEKWGFIEARLFIEYMGSEAKNAPAWWPYISKELSLANAKSTILVDVKPRGSYSPLLHLAVSPRPDLLQYNIEGLAKTDLKLYVPEKIIKKVELFQLERSRAELIRIEKEKKDEENRRKYIEEQQIAARQALEERQKQEEEKHRLISHLIPLAERFKIDKNLLLDDQNQPTYEFNELTYFSTGECYDEAHLLALRKSKILYLAAAAHWRQWELKGDRWAAIQTCSLLRRINHSQKAIRLMRSIDTNSWSGAIAAAYYTTYGGALRDQGDFVAACHSANTSISFVDNKPHPYLLLGAIYYQTNRHEQGNEFFEMAKIRGATDQDVRNALRQISRDHNINYDEQADEIPF